MPRQLLSAFYRDWIRITLFRYEPKPGRDPDDDLRELLEGRHAEASGRIAALVAEGADAGRVREEGVDLFIYAVGLFAYGHAEVAEEILEFMPRAPIRKLAGVLPALLPLPGRPDVLAEPHTIRAWLEQHRGKLRWIEKLGRYAVDDGQIADADQGIIACLDAQPGDWKLDPVWEGRLVVYAFFGGTSGDHEAAIPAPAAAVLARAMTSLARVTFSSSGGGMAQGDETFVVAPRTLATRILAAFERHPPEITMVSTRNPTTASTLFNDPGRPFTVPHQAAMLTAPDAGAPQIDRRRLGSLLDGAGKADLVRLYRKGVRAVVRPGVHGRSVCVLFVAEDLHRAWEPALEDEARRSGLSLLPLPSHSFLPLVPLLG